MKLLAALLAAPALAFTLTAEGKTLFACESTSKALNPGAKLHFKLDQDDAGKFQLKVNGVDDSSAVKTNEASLNNLANFLKCKDGDDACYDKNSNKNDGSKDMSTLVALARMTNKAGTKDKELKGMASSLGKINPAKIDHAKMYTFGNTTKYGNLGVYEFYDKGGKLLGRYVYAVEVLECLDKATPTKDDGKMLKELQKDAPKEKSEIQR